MGLILILRLSSVTRWVKCAPSDLSVYDLFFLLMFILPEKKKRKTKLEFYRGSCLQTNATLVAYLLLISIK